MKLGQQSKEVKYWGEAENLHQLMVQKAFMWKTGNMEWEEGLKTSVELRQHFRDWKFRFFRAFY